MNENGQLGIDFNNNKDTPTLVNNDTDWSLIGSGIRYSMALKTNNKLYSWGQNSNGQLGQGNKNNNYHVPTLVNNTWTYFNAGSYFSFAIDSNYKEMYVTGVNTSGELGLGYRSDTYISSPIIFSTAENNDWKEIFVSNVNNTDTSGHNFGIKNDGSLWAWGENSFGKLGINKDDNEVVFKTTPTLVSAGPWKSVAIGYEHTLGLQENGKLYAWGRNNVGQLGLGVANTNHYISPQEITSPSWTSIKAIAANHYSSFVITNENKIYGWGYNLSGQLGIGDNTSTVNPTQEFSNSTNWKSIYTGAYHIIAVKNDNTLWSWGLNGNGELGNNNIGVSRNIPGNVSGNITDATTISVGAYHNVIIRSDHSLWGWGSNGEGQLNLPVINNKIGVPTLISNANWIDVNGGAYSTGAIKSDNTLWTCGKNVVGQLGLGYISQRVTTLTQVGYYNIWTNILSGGGCMFGFMSNNEIWTWGGNLYGQLGIVFSSFTSFTEVPCTGDDNFTSFSSYNVSVNTIASSKLKLNGQDRFRERDATYFNYIQPYQHFEIKPDTGINSYSFALKPAEHQPSGTCNFSRIDNIDLEIIPTINPTEGSANSLKLSIYAFSYNILRIASGMGGLAFSN